MAITVFIIMMGILMGIVSQSSRILQQANGQKTNRQTARILLELIGRDLENSMIGLNPVTDNLRFEVNPTSLSGSGYLNPQAAFWQTTASGNGASTGDIIDVGYFVNWVIDSEGLAHGTLCRMTIPPTNTDSIFQSPNRTLTAALLNTYAPGLSNTNLGSGSAYKGLLADNVLGLWIALYDTNMVVLALPYDSRILGARPAYADVSLAILDPIVAKRINAGNLGSITNNYASATNAASFIEKLSQNIQAGAQSFESRIPLQTGQ